MTVHPVQKQHMKMNIHVQSAAEALDQGHGAGLCRGLCEPCLAGQMRGDGVVDNGKRLFELPMTPKRVGSAMAG